VTTKYDPQLIVSLSIPEPAEKDCVGDNQSQRASNGDSHTREIHLNDCFDHYYEESNLPGIHCGVCCEKAKCDEREGSCRSGRQEHKLVTKLCNLSEIMVLHLKRDNVRRRGSGENVKVNFDLDNVEIWDSVAGKNIAYECVSLVNHLTDPVKHYVAVTKRGDKWFQHDDSAQQRMCLAMK
jgi:ubiquitin C-terminal hydrolase